MIRNNKIRIPLKLSDEDRVCNVLCMLMLGLYIVNIFPGFEEVLGISHIVVSGTIKAILGAGFILCMDVFFRRLKKHTIFVCLITVMIILMSIVFFPHNNVVFVSTAIYFMGNCFLPIIFFGIVYDFECLRRKMVKTSETIAVLSMIILLLSVISIGSGFRFSLGDYAMGFGYACLVPCLLLMAEFLKKPTFKHGLFIVVILAALMSFGSRGPLLGIASFIVIAFIKINHEKKKDVRIIFGFLMGIAFILFSGTIFAFLRDYLYEMGIESRTLILLSSNIGHMSGRDKLYRFFLNEILSNPLTIHGINGEQALGFNYPHNIFLELLYQFGVILGGGITLVIIFKAIKTLRLEHINVNAKEQLEMVFMCASLPTMMVSGTLWKQMEFWIWITISGTKDRNGKREIREKTS